MQKMTVAIMLFVTAACGVDPDTAPPSTSSNTNVTELRECGVTVHCPDGTEIVSTFLECHDPADGPVDEPPVSDRTALLRACSDVCSDFTICEVGGGDYSKHGAFGAPCRAVDDPTGVCSP